MPPRPRPPRSTSTSGPNRSLVVAIVALVLVAAAVAVAAVLVVGDDQEAAPPPSPETTAAQLEFLDGIPQDGAVLGDPAARVTLIEYADLQCPVCRTYAEEGFPGLVEEYVRPGRVKLEFRGLAFIGPDSERAARLVLAAGLQDRLWHLADALYGAQGAENSGWVTDALVRELAGGIDGLDADRMYAAADSEQVTRALARSREQAQAAEVPGTPWFFIRIGDGEPYEIRPTSLTPAGFREALDAALAG